MFGIKIDKEAVIKILKSAVISGAGAGAVYAIEGLGNLNFGIYTPLMVALSAWLINTIKVALNK